MRRLLLTLLLAAGSAQAAIDIADDTGQALHLAQPAKRIVSLAPHITEMLFAAGAGDRVVGAVQYSDYPEAAKKIARVGGYTSVDMEKVAALKPDLVVAWKSGNRGAHLDKLRALGIPVFINEPRRIDDVARSIAQLGKLAGTDSAGEAAAQAFRKRHAALAAKYSARPPVRIFYEAWQATEGCRASQALQRGRASQSAACGRLNAFGSAADGVRRQLNAAPPRASSRTPRRPSGGCRWCDRAGPW